MKKSNQKSLKINNQNIPQNKSKLRKTIFAAAVIAVFAFTAAYSFDISPRTLTERLFGSPAKVAPDAETVKKLREASRKTDDKTTNLASAALTNGTLTNARQGHTATRLGDGNVLIAGGDAGTFEIFNPLLNTSSAYGNLNTARSGHTATRLADGRVLIAGGADTNGAALSSTEIYDLSTGAFAEDAPMNTARTGHTATVLADGRILILGGDVGGTAEIYDAATGSFTSLDAAMTVSRSGHSAALMNDGRVLIVGGSNADGEKLNSAEIFNPADSTFSETGNAMAHQRTRAVLRVLPDGKVQIIGGNDDLSMEVYDPAIDSIGAHAHLIPTNDEHDALLQIDILNAQTRAALFNTGQTDTLLDRTNHSITELDDQALVAGGSNSDGQTLNSLSILNSSNASVTTDKLDYQPGQTAIISGSGWQPNETVNIILHEDPHTSTSERRLAATADDNGNFSINYGVEDYDLRITFIVGAKGQTSNRTAQTTFTDASPGSLGNYATSGLSGVTTSVSPSNVASNVTFSSLTRGAGLTAESAASGFNSSSWQASPTLTTAGNTDYLEFTVTPNAGFQFSASELRVGLLRSGSGPSKAELRSSLDSYGSTIGSVITVSGSITTSTINLSSVSGLQNSSSAVTFRIYGYSASSSVGTMRVQNNTSPTMVGLEVDGTVASACTAPSISVDPSSATKNVGESVTFSVTASGTASLSYQWRKSGVDISGATSSSYTINSLTTADAGNYDVVVSNGCGSATSTAAVLTVNKLNQNITFSALADKTFGDADFNVSATASSGLTVSFAASGNCTVSGATVHITGAGSCTITASQAGDATYNAASNVQQSFNIAKATPTITWNNPADITYGTALSATQLNATASVGGSFSYTPASGIVLNAGGAQTLHVDFTPTDAANYNNASKDISINVLKANATITVNGYTGVYDGAAHGATGSATGVGGADLSGQLNLGATFTNVPGGTANWTFTGGTNYNDANGSVAIVINKADANCSVNGYTGVYDGDPHGASGSCTGVSSENLAGLSLGASFANVPGGTSNWSFTDTTGNYNNQSGSAAITIAKANANCAIIGYTGTYDGSLHGASGNCTGIGGSSDVLSGLNLGATFTNVPGGSADWTLTDTTGNYNNANGSVAIVINKANATVNVSGYTGVYDGAAHGATGTATGINNEDLSAGFNFGATFADVPGGTANWTFDGGTNYNNQNGTASIVINKADAVCSVSGYTGVYDALSHGASGSCTGVSGALSGLDLGATFVNVPGGTSNWSFTGGTNYNDQSGSVEIVINKADAIVNVVGYTGVYDASAHNATGSATGVGGVNLSGSLNLGSSFTDVPGGTANWTFTGGTNYNDQSGSVAITINKAEAVCTISGYSDVYDAMPHGASGSCTGILNEALSGLNLGATFTNVPGSTANWTFTDVTGNYNDTGGNAEIVINKADASIAVTPYSVIFDGNPHTAGGTATGVSGESLSGLDLSATAHTDAGTYNGDVWTFTDATGNYNNAGGTVDDYIGKASAVISITPYSGGYDGNPHGLTGTATGVGGADLSAGLNFGSTFTNVPGGTATWTFAGGTNYNDDTGTAAVTITKANAVITVTPYNVTYDGTAHTASGTAVGVSSEDLSSLLDLSLTTHTNAGIYSGDAWSFAGNGNYNSANGTVNNSITKAEAICSISGYTGVYDAAAHGATGTCTGVGGSSDVLSGLDLGASFTDVPGGTAHWVLTGGTNYSDQSGDAAINISKANASVIVTGYTGVYDAMAHVASGSATGVGGVDLTSNLDLGASFTNVPGGTAHWTFSGGTNYTDQSGDAAIAINKADATCTVNGYTGVYDAAAHGASGSCGGVGGADLSTGLNFGATFTDVPGGTANWTFAGGTNYNDQNGSAAIVITKANASVTVNGYTGVYDGAAHGASGSATGVGGVNLNAGLNFGASFTDVPGGTANWTFSGGTNYTNQNGSVEINISKADANCAISGYGGNYDALPHGASGSCTGVSGETLAGLVLGGSFTNVPGGTANWSFTDVTGNYKDQSNSVAINISKINANCSSIVGYSGSYNAAAHGATGICTGVDAGGAATGGTLNLGDSFTNVPGGMANWAFTGGTNYNDQSGSAAIVITKANANCSISGYTGVYDGAAHGATGSCTGVDSAGSAAGSNLSLGASFTDVPGGTANWAFTGGTNYNNQSGSVAITINKATATITVTPYNITYDTLPHTATGTAFGVGGANLSSFLNLSGTTHTNAGTYNDSWSFNAGGNYFTASGSVTDVINARNALVNYIGQTNWVTSGTSSTTAQVTLSASVQDPTGTALVGAKMDFIDASNNKVLASGVNVSPVAGSTANTGTANTIVTLSTGQYGAESYVILVRMSGNYTNAAQPVLDKTATVVVSKPAATNEAIGGGKLNGLASSAGTYRSNIGAQICWTVGMTYNKSGTNPQGKITVTIPQPDGSLFYVKSNSISSMAITNVSNGKKGTIYTKSSITKILSDGTSITIQGNVSLRMDINDYTTGADEVGFTVLSSSNSELFYSNNWLLDSATNAWRTIPQAIATGTVKIN